MTHHAYQAFILPLVLLFPTLLAAGAPAPPTLHIELLLDKTTYLLQEPIWVDVLIVNWTSDTLTIPFPTPEGDFFRFVVVENDRDTLPYGGMYTEFLEHPYCEVPPGDTLYNVYDLGSAYEYSAKSTEQNPVRLTGKVSVTGLYVTDHRSNTLELTIEEPTGSEEDAWELWNAMASSRGDTNRQILAEQLLGSYPTSAYAQKACHWLFVRGGQYLSEGRRHFANLMIESYPNSGYAVGCMLNYLGEVDREERAAKLESLQGPDKPLRLQMIARNFQRGFSFISY